MRRTLLDNSSRWTLSFPNLDLVPGASGELAGVFRSQHSWFTLFSDKNLEITQPNCVNSFNIATDPSAPPFFDLLLGIPSFLNMSEMSFCRHVHNLFSEL